MISPVGGPAPAQWPGHQGPDKWQSQAFDLVGKIQDAVGNGDTKSVADLSGQLNNLMKYHPLSFPHDAKMAAQQYLQDAQNTAENPTPNNLAMLGQAMQVFDSTIGYPSGGK